MRFRVCRCVVAFLTMLVTNRRYLRARRWVPNDAYQQFHETEEWRKANDIDLLYHTIEVDAYEQSRRLVRFLPWC